MPSSSRRSSRRPAKVTAEYVERTLARILRVLDGVALLAYELGRVMVEMMAADWATYRSVVLDARYEDAGTDSARRHLGVDLGEYACALVEKAYAPQSSPDPAQWHVNACAPSPSHSRNVPAGDRARSPR